MKKNHVKFSKTTTNKQKIVKNKSLNHSCRRIFSIHINCTPFDIYLKNKKIKNHKVNSNKKINSEISKKNKIQKRGKTLNERFLN